MTVRQCTQCCGDGQLVIGEHHVTRDMALDACEPSMEGMFYGYEYVPCNICHGEGVIMEENYYTEEDNKMPCPTCIGEGHVPTANFAYDLTQNMHKICNSCNGTGLVERVDYESDNTERKS